MALIILQVLVLGVLAAAADDVPVTWWVGPRAELPCIVPDPAPGLSLHKPPPLRDEDSPKTRQWIWRKGTTEISGKRILSNGTLEVNRKNEGVYQCSTHQHGGIVLGLPINLKFVSIDKQFTKHPENATARAGQPHAISCEIRSAPVASLSWLKDGQPLPYDDRYHNLTYQLLILDVKKEDAGVYVCIAHNRFGQSRTSNSGTLQVYDGGEDLEPALLPVHHEEHLIVPLDGRVVLPCPVLGSPRPTLIWKHTPPGGRRGEIDFTGEVLVLSAIRLDEEGYYSCEVEGNDELVKKFNVTVTTPVVITEPPAQDGNVTRIVHRAGTARFNCTASGHPAPHVTWYKDGVPVSPVKILSNRDRQQLVIGGVTSEHAGIYQCVVGGVRSAWAALAVVGQVAAAPRGLRCRPLAAARLDLSWNRTHANATYYVQYTDLEFGLPGTKPVTGMPHLNNKEVITLDKALTLYKFKVRAFVLYVSGTHTASDMSEEIVCQGQGVPIKLIQMYGDTVMVSWEQFAVSNPGVVEWILQYRNSSDKKNITFAGHLYNYTLHAPKSSPLQVRVLGSRSKVWTKQDLSLVPWVKTVDTDDDDRKSIPAPSNVTISRVEEHSLMVEWAHGEGGAGGAAGAGRGHVYEVCLRSMDGVESCQDSNVKSLYITNLEHETEYDIRVRVKDSAGSHETSEFSAPQHITTVAEGGLGVPTMGQLFYTFTETGSLRVRWAGDPALYTVHYSNQLKLPIDGWPAINTTGTSVLITGLEPTQETFVMVMRHEPRMHSNILTVPPQINGPELHDLKYEYFSTAIRVSWTAPALSFVRFSQNITVPMENWTRVNITTGNSIVLENVNVSRATYVSVSASESQWYNGGIAILTIPPQSESQLVYLVAGVVVGVIALVLMALVGIWLWRKRKQNLSPLRSRRRNTGNKSNEEDGSEMKNVGGRLANGGGSMDAGEPLLNGHVHIIENPTSKTPNGKMGRGRLEAAFDVSRFDEHNATLETVLDAVLDADTSASTTYNFLDTSRRPEYEVSKSSRDVSSNNSFSKLPDDNMNSELTRSTDFDLESSKIQPTLQPNG